MVLTISAVGTRPRLFPGQSWRIRQDALARPIALISWGMKVGDANPRRIFPPFSQLITMGLWGSSRVEQRYSRK